MKKRIVFRVCAIATTTAILMPPAAVAGFVDMDASSYDASRSAKAGKGPDSASGKPSPAVGFGKDMPLPVAVRQILDSAGVAFAVDIPDAYKARTVSWEAGPVWPAVLEKAVSPLGLSPEINWSENRIGFVEKKPADPDGQKQSAQAKPQTFEVRKADGFVSASLARWAKEAGWQIVWDTDVDLVVDAEASYRGSFEQSVESLFSELSASKIPLKAVLYQGNKVIRITKYEGANKK